MKVWGIHMGEHVGADPVEKHYVGIGWPNMGNLQKYSGSRENFKKALQDTHPDIKAGAIPGNAGVLYRFTNVMQIGDIVVYPSKSDRMVNIGKVIGDYEYVESDDHGYTNHRRIDWLGHFPRNEFSQAALNEIGAFVTLFSVKRHDSEFLAKIGLSEGGSEDEDDESDIADDESATGSVTLQAEQSTEDFIIKQIYNKLDGYEFEYFVAHILECMGYKTRTTPKSRDGGVDIVAHADELGFEPPIIKVQCKKSTGQNGEPDINQLLGTLGEGEYALFVNLGSYSMPAKQLERNKAKLRLVDGDKLVDLILEHYSKLSPKYRTLLPLKQIYVPDLK